MPPVAKITVDPGWQERRRECLEVDGRIKGVVRIPRIDWEDRLDNRRVILILHIELSELVQTTAVR